MREFWRFLSSVYYSLPIQLVIIQISKHKGLLFIWVIVWGWMSGSFGARFGFKGLFLDPEYMGEVTLWSMMITGCAFGMFMFTYMITLYIHESYRFHFLALEREPFFTFCLNNAILPGSFLFYYLSRFMRVHVQDGGDISVNISFNILGLFLGIILVFFLCYLYFFRTNTNVSRLFGGTLKKQLRYYQRSQQIAQKKMIIGKAKEGVRSPHKVHWYLNWPFRVERVNPSPPIEFSKIVRILNQHHLNLLLFYVCGFVLISLLGLIDDEPYFHIPAGASIFLLLSFIMLTMGLFTFWFRRLGVLAFALVIGIAFLYGNLTFFREFHQAFGLDYEKKPVAYTQEAIRSLAPDSLYQNDRKRMIATLDKWKDAYVEKHGKNPKAVFVCASGGGLKSAYWTMHILQQMDSLTNGKLSDNIRLMTGASGGMFGEAYFREMMIRKMKEEDLNISDQAHSERLSKDLLNRIIFKLFTDMFLPNQTFKIGDKVYDRERGYAFDHQMALNMPELAGKKLGDYRELEASGKIPIMVLTPTMVNQRKKLFISASDVSFLVRPNYITNQYVARSQGIEFRRMFANHDADSLWFTTALRVNATFPFVLPQVELPSDPAMVLMDAGVVDNYGTQTAVWYLYEFRKWFARNTDGVVILQIRDSKRNEPIHDVTSGNYWGRILAPLGDGYQSMGESRDMANDQMLEFLRDWYSGYIEVLTFELVEAPGDHTIAMSMHLTEKEKRYIRNNIYREHNQHSTMIIQSLFGEEEKQD